MAVPPPQPTPVPEQALQPPPSAAAKPASAPPTSPAAAATLAPAVPASPATPAPEPGSVEALRLQYKKAGADDATATEKAIATAALEPPELKFRLSQPETMAQAEAASAVATPPIPKPPENASTPGAINPLTGLRVPTPELAAAFLASNPTPAGAAPTATPASTASTDKASPPTGPKPARKKTANPESILLVVGGILAVLLGGGLTGAYLFLRTPKKATTPPPVVSEELPPDATETTPPTDADTASTTTENVSPTDGSGITPATTTSPESTTVASGPDTPSTSTSAPTTTPPPPPPPPPRVNQPDPTVLAWIQKIELTGIRGGQVPKVFMNGKLWEVGEVVNYELGVKLVGIKGKILQFEDAQGNTYEYRF